MIINFIIDLLGWEYVSYCELFPPCGLGSRWPILEEFLLSIGTRTLWDADHLCRSNFCFCKFVAVCACNYWFASTIWDPYEHCLLLIANTNKTCVERAVMTDSLKCYTPLKMTALYQHILQKILRARILAFPVCFNSQAPLIPTHVLEDSSILILLWSTHKKIDNQRFRVQTPSTSLYQSSRYVWMKTLRSVPLSDFAIIEVILSGDKFGNFNFG